MQAEEVIEQLMNEREEQKERSRVENSDEQKPRDDQVDLKGVMNSPQWDINFKEDAWREVIQQIELKEQDSNKSKHNCAMKRVLLNIVRKYNGDELEF